jgi:two-component system cell cycle sensor histidine kinase/response regulator CckA
MPGHEASSEPTRQKDTRRNVVRVLLADDEESVRMLTTRILAREGWQVMAVSDGRAAVSAWPPDGDPFDIIILDVRMPGMSGREAFKELSKAHPDANFLFISGYAGGGECSDLPQGEGVSFLAKPFSPGDLIAKARALVCREPVAKTLAVGGQSS